MPPLPTRLLVISRKVLGARKEKMRGIALFPFILFLILAPKRVHPDRNRTAVGARGG